MIKSSNKNDLEQIYQRLDNLANIIEKSYDEAEDVSEIRSIVEDLRANLLTTIDERVEYILGKQRDIYNLIFSQLEEKIKTITANSKDDTEELRSQLLSNMTNIKEDLLRNITGTDQKITEHLKDKINWKQLVLPGLITGMISVSLVVFITLIDHFFSLGLLDMISKFQP